MSGLVDFGEVIRRKSSIKGLAFPFEVAHIAASVRTMPAFHWHEYVEISYIVGGKGRYFIEEKEIFVRKGDIIIINNVERHRVIVDGELCETVLHFDKELIPDFSGKSLFDYETTLFYNKPDISGQSYVSSLIDGIVNEYLDKKPGYELNIMGNLCLFMSRIMREQKAIRLPTVEARTRGQNIKRLDQIQKFIQSNIKDDVSLKDVAKQFGLTEAYFSEYFKKNLGVGFSTYKNMIKIDNVIKLMENKSITILDAAFESGFNSESGLYSTFSRVTGMSPKQYLEKIKNEAQPKIE